MEKVAYVTGKDPYLDRLNMRAAKPYVVEPSGRVPIDHADAVKDAGYYVNSELRAKKQMYITSAPNGTKLRSVAPGEYVGKIYSYLNRDGKLYWQLAGKSGNGDGGFVENVPGAFDTQILVATASGQQHDQLLEDLNKDDVITETVKTVGAGVADTVGGVGKSLSFIGNNMGLIIFGILAVVAVMYLNRPQMSTKFL